MTNFAFFHTGQWRDGNMPKIEGATHIVSHDTRHHGYIIQHEDQNSFLEWVGATFSGDNDPMFGVDFDGDIYEYLENIDVSVREA